MFNTNGPGAMLHVVAECNCVSKEQLCKEAINDLPPVVFSSQNTRFADKTNSVKHTAKPTDKYRDNVISFTAVNSSSRSLKKRHVKEVGAIKFNYPMLECS
jgi:hypothetical protein